ncbi:MAG TPA: hypothetical protein V6D16_14330, partial [Candidatus Obscuribacterales bacterium]
DPGVENIFCTSFKSYKPVDGLPIFIPQIPGNIRKCPVIATFRSIDPQYLRLKTACASLSN